MDDDLEAILHQDKQKRHEPVNQNNLSRSGIAAYCIDTSAAWVFWTPMMATMEYAVADMSSAEVLRSRLFSIGFHAVMMRPYCKFREFWARYWDASPKSSPIKKMMVDCSALMIQQAPSYSLILSLSGASLKEIGLALPTGLVMGMVAGRPYGYFIDRWRRYWGAQAVLD